jgi:PAS domain S-box-containing protein
MELRTKTLVIFGVGLILILASFAVYSSYVLQKSYENIERAEVHGDLQRVEFALENELGDLDSRLSDWSRWDDTYFFVAGSNPGYLEENLQKETFMNLDLDYILIFNQSKELIYGMEYNKNTGNIEPVSPSMLEVIARNYPLLTFNAPETDPSVKGVFFVESQPSIIALQPVLKSNGKGPAEGIMIMGRNFDGSRIDKLTKSSGVSVGFIDPVTLAGDPHLTSMMDQSSLGNPVVIQPESQNIILGYVYLQELNITPDNYVIKISEPRIIYQSGISTLYSFLLIVLVAVLLSGLLGLFLIDRMVLSRISLITNDVRKIGPGNENIRITEVPGNDELTQLSIAINRMLEQISLMHMRYKSIVEDQSEMICRFYPDGTITFMNPAFKKSIRRLNRESEPLSIYESLHSPVTKETLDNILQTVTYQSPIVPGEQEYLFEGEEYTIAWTIRGIFDQEGMLQEYQYVGKDITARKQAENALQQVTRKLALLNQVTFNEIHNAIFTMSGYLSLERTLSKEENAREYLEYEEESVRRIEKSINFAKQYQDLGAKPPEWQDINQAFIFGISHLDLSSIHRKIQLDNLEIYADTLLEQVFFTLAGNVIRHAKNATEITLNYQLTGEGLLLTFCDNGIGIPDAAKEKIFERGYGSQKGMELFLVREILGITEISIRENGTFGSGACFEIFVPKRAYRFPEKY